MFVINNLGDLFHLQVANNIKGFATPINLEIEILRLTDSQIFTGNFEPRMPTIADMNK